MKKKKYLRWLLSFVLAVAMIAAEITSYSLSARAEDAAANVVNIPDAEFKAVLNKKLGVSDLTASITEEQLKTITYLVIESDSVTDITGIGHCSQLKSLTINAPQLENGLNELSSCNFIDTFILKYLKSGVTLPTLSSVKTLYLQPEKNSASEEKYNVPVNIMDNFPNLVSINMRYMYGWGDEDFAQAMSKTDLAKLSILVIQNTSMTVLPDLTGAVNLEILSIKSNSSLTDISKISKSQKLSRLELDNNSSLHDISALNGLSNVTYLDLEKVTPTEETIDGYVQAVSSMTKLTRISLAFCGIGEVDENRMSDIFNPLQSLTEINVGFNNLTDIGFLLSHKDTLKRLSVYANYDIDDTDARDVLAKLTNLETLGFGSTKIVDYSFLKNFPNLKNDSLRWAEGDENFKRVTSVSRETTLDSEDDVFEFENPVKDIDGNPIAPMNSETNLYSYDKNTNKITVKYNKSTVRINFDFETIYPNNKTVYSTVTIAVKTNMRLHIVEQPENISKNSGESASLSVNALGTGALKYQWYKDGQPVNNKTSSKYNFTILSRNDEGTYFVVVSDNNESVTSDSVTVEVIKKITPLSILEQPADTIAIEGTGAGFSVKAAGEGTLSYQWYKDDIAIDGANKNSLEFNAVTLQDAGNYKVVVKDSTGEVTSSAAKLTVDKALKITEEPVAIELKTGETGKLSVVAEGEGTLSYQWYKDDSAVEGATGPELEFDNISEADAGTYKVRVGDKNGSIDSQEVSVTVLTLVKLSITAQPKSIEVEKGATASLKVEAVGDGDLSYKWYKDGNEIENENKAELVLSTNDENFVGTYKVVVSDANTSITSDEVKVTLKKEQEEPTGTPEETPTATPEETPGTTPEITPTVTPEETPTGTPEETPTAVPEETTTAQPQKTPTAAPEETPASKPDDTSTEKPVQNPEEDKTTLKPDEEKVEKPGEKSSQMPKATASPNAVNTIVSKGAPKTGEDSTVIICIVAGVLSSIIVVGAYSYKKRRD